MLNALKKLFGIKRDERLGEAEAPYKVEANPNTEQASQAVIESIAPVKKPASKKPRTPRKPKAAK
jgi:hypothetical protein